MWPRSRQNAWPQRAAAGSIGWPGAGSWKTIHIALSRWPRREWPDSSASWFIPASMASRWSRKQQLRAALPHIARSGLPLLVHAELPGPISAATERFANADWSLYETYLASRPEEAELAAIRMLLALCREFRFRLHIVHLSASQALSELRAARSEGLPVSVETCPHYLYLTAEAIPRGATLFKCAPPVRSGKNRDALWQGLRDGMIDLVATDHSPCPPEMKRLDGRKFWNCMGRNREFVAGVAADVHRCQRAWIFTARYRALDGGSSGEAGWLRPAERRALQRGMTPTLLFLILKANLK